MFKTQFRIYLFLILSVFLSSVAFAGNGDFAKDHPRRAEVNQRLNNQNARINKEVKEGEISKGQAAKLHREDRQMRQEERRMAGKQGGAITKQQQARINKQENQVSRQIGQ